MVPHVPFRDPHRMLPSAFRAQRICHDMGGRVASRCGHACGRVVVLAPVVHDAGWFSTSLGARRAAALPLSSLYPHTQDRTIIRSCVGDRASPLVAVRQVCTRETLVTGDHLADGDVDLGQFGKQCRPFVGADIMVASV